MTYTLHLVGELELATADFGWTSAEILEAKAKRLLTSKVGGRKIDSGGDPSLLSAANDVAWRNT